MDQPSRPERLSIIVAASDNGVIGRGGELPWRLSADLQRFKRLTMGHALVMGRKTYESLGRPLPGRTSIVITRDPGWRAKHDGVLVATNVDEALALAATAPGESPQEAFIIGGGEIYRLFLPHTDRVHLTRVHTTIEGDATFPELSTKEWQRTDTEPHPADEKNEFDCSFEYWQRNS